MFHGITDLATFVIGTVLIVLLPGPNSLYVMSVASRSGVAAGYQAACGVFLGDAVLMSASAMGVASLLRAVPAVFLIVKIAGALYLAWLGLGMLRGCWRLWRVESDTPAPAPRPLDVYPFRTALLISLMNPKAMLFFLSFFIQFVDAQYSRPGLSFVILGTIVQICSALYLSALIFGGSRLAAQFSRQRRAASIGTGTVGALFLGFAAKLATATLR